MKTLLPILLSVLAAIPTHMLASGFAGGQRSTAESTTRAEVETEIERISVRLADLEQRVSNQEDARVSGSTTLAGTRRTSLAPGFEDADIAAAAERWLESNAVAARAATEPEERPRSERARAVASMSLEEVMRFLSSSTHSNDEIQVMYEELRQAGRMDEVVAEFERMAEENPDAPELQVAVGVAYLQKLFEVGGAEAGVWAMKADGAFDNALVLDDQNWEARFTKAIALSNWPAFMGKTAVAVENFETLIAQQEKLPAEPQFAQTYFFLGNVYSQAGDQEKALETWQNGLALFPLDEALLERIESSEE